MMRVYFIVAAVQMLLPSLGVASEIILKCDWIRSLNYNETLIQSLGDVSPLNGGKIFQIYDIDTDPDIKSTSYGFFGTHRDEYKYADILVTKYEINFSLFHGDYSNSKGLEDVVGYFSISRVTGQIKEKYYKSGIAAMTHIGQCAPTDKAF